MLFVVSIFRQNELFRKTNFRNAIKMSNGMDPDQVRRLVGPDLGPNCLQILSVDDTKSYGSLYVTLCFVLWPFDFGVLTIYFCMLSSLFVYNVAHFKRRNSRGRAKMEHK